MDLPEGEFEKHSKTTINIVAIIAHTDYVCSTYLVVLGAV